MNVLFLTLCNIENIDERGIYTDLVRELASNGINMHVVCPREKRENRPTELIERNDIKILAVRSGNITATGNFIEKGFSTLCIEKQYLNAVNRFFKGTRFDMVMYSTPPITFARIARHFKKYHKSKTYLVLKDIFPQNAVDIGLMRKGSLVWKYFRAREKELYNVSDYIGCMSQANVDYLLQHNPYLESGKVEIFPNAILPVELREWDKAAAKRVFSIRYGIPEDKILFVYGGNLGKPQGVDFLLEVIEHFGEVKNSYLLIVGSGTEYNKIEKFLGERNFSNIRLMERLPKEEYDRLLEAADVGLIFLDRRFTIPNFPSRLTSYMEYSLPVLAATDRSTDLKDVLMDSGSGFWCESGDLGSFIRYANRLAEDESLRKDMGKKARDYLQENYDIRKSVRIILKHLQKLED